MPKTIVIGETAEGAPLEIQVESFAEYFIRLEGGK